MKITHLGCVLVTTLVVGCEDEVIMPPPPASTGARVSSTATPSSGGTTATPGASASAAAVDLCKKRKLELGGTGTKESKCKVEGDVLVAATADRVDEEGAVFKIDNPWEEEVTRIWAAVYYYDAAGKQLTVEQRGNTLRVAKVEDYAVSLPGKATTEVPLGFPKKEIPAAAEKIQTRIWAFGWDKEGEAAYFQSNMPFSEFRGVDGGDGPTGIETCDAYRTMLESCPKQFPDALEAMRKSLREFNNAAPQTKERLVTSLTGRCEQGKAAIEERCKPEE